MSTTSTFQGYDLGRSTSKVLAAPGGASSMGGIFGGYEEPKPAAKPAPAAVEPAAPAAVAQSAEPAKMFRPSDNSRNNIFGDACAEEPMKSEMQRANEGGSGAAPAPVEQKPQHAAGFKPSTRVRAPPGGASSNIFG